MVLFLTVFPELQLAGPRCSQIHKGFHASLFSGPESSDSLSVVNILDDPAVQGDVDDSVFNQVVGVARATATGRRVVSGGARTAHANAGESKGNFRLLEVLESDFSKNRAGHSAAVNATAGERSGVPPHLPPPPLTHTHTTTTTEAGLFRAQTLAGGPIAAGSSAFLGRGFLRIRSRRLGGRAVGGTGSSRLYRTSQNDEVDKHCAQFFVNSSLSPVLLFRRRLKSVADVLKGIRSKGFTQSRWDALLRYWGCCMSSWSVWSHFFSSSLGKLGSSRSAWFL